MPTTTTLEATMLPRIDRIAALVLNTIAAQSLPGRGAYYTDVARVHSHLTNNLTHKQLRRALDVLIDASLVFALEGQGVGDYALTDSGNAHQYLLPANRNRGPHAPKGVANA